MAADAKSMSENYVDRMKRKVWPLVQRYWFDALVVIGAIGGAVEVIGVGTLPTYPHPRS